MHTIGKINKEIHMTIQIRTKPIYDGEIDTDSFRVKKEVKSTTIHISTFFDLWIVNCITLTAKQLAFNPFKKTRCFIQLNHCMGNRPEKVINCITATACCPLAFCYSGMLAKDGFMLPPQNQHMS